MDLNKRNSALALVALLGIFTVSFLVSIEGMSRIPLCFFKHFTQLDCPGCGLSRSFISLSHGHFWEAIRFNALGPILYLYFLAYLYKHFMNLIGSTQGKITWRLSPFIQHTFLLLLIGQWILKLAKQIPHIIS